MAPSRLVLSLILGFFIAWIFVVFARAHDHARLDLNSWFESLHSGKGPCCSGDDGTALSDVDWKTVDGHYQVVIDGKWWDVPDDAVITEPNLAHKAMVWPVRNWAIGGELNIMIRCFMPGDFG